MRPSAFFEGIFAFTAVIALMVLFGTFYTIDQGARGAVLRNGAFMSTAEPGLHFKLPVIDDVVEISVQQKARLFENVATYSSDQQPATMNVSVNYRLPADQIQLIYSDYGGEDGIVSRIIDRKLPEQLKNVFGRFNAVTAINDRARLNAEVQLAVQKATERLPVVIESVQIENIDFSDAYEQSVEQRMLAEVEVQRQRQEWEKEKVSAEITVTKAKADADAARAKADADAYTVKIKGDAEAAAIRAKGEALRDNPGLVGLVSAERWNGIMPSTMVPGSALPFLGIK